MLLKEKESAIVHSHALTEKDCKLAEESLKDEVSVSFGTGFELALEQVKVLHLGIDLSAIGLCKSVVDDQLIAD